MTYCIDENKRITSNVENIARTVIAYYKWEPAAIGRLFWDRESWDGLIYWYDLAKEAMKK